MTLERPALHLCPVYPNSDCRVSWPWKASGFLQTARLSFRAWCRPSSFTARHYNGTRSQPRRQLSGKNDCRLSKQFRPVEVATLEKKQRKIEHACLTRFELEFPSTLRQLERTSRCLL